MKKITLFIVGYCLLVYLLGAFLAFEWDWLKYIATNQFVRLALITAMIPFVATIVSIISDQNHEKEMANLKS